MGIWKGIYMGLQDIEAQKEKEADREEQRQARMSEILERRRATVLKLAESGGLNKPTMDAVEHTGSVLTNRFGVKEETVANLAATAGAAGLDQALKVLDAQRVKYEEAGKTLPQEVVTQVFEGAIVTASSGGSIDFDKVQEYMGTELDPLDRELLTRSNAQAPQVYIPEPAFVAPPRLQDVDLMERRANAYLVQNAGMEVQTLNKTLNQIQQAEQSETDPTKLKELEDTKAWILERQSSVQDALSSAEGDGGNPTGLVALYGNEFFNKMFEADPRMKLGVVSPLYENPVSVAPKRVESMQVLRSLARAGIIKVGDVVEILDPETGEYVTQRIGD